MESQKWKGFHWRENLFWILNLFSLAEREQQARTSKTFLSSQHTHTHTQKGFSKIRKLIALIPALGFTVCWAYLSMIFGRPYFLSVCFATILCWCHRKFKSAFLKQQHDCFKSRHSRKMKMLISSQQQYRRWSRLLEIRRNSIDIRTDCWYDKTKLLNWYLVNCMLSSPLPTLNLSWG